MRRLLLAIALGGIALTACTKKPNGETKYSGEFQIAELFTHDGCTAYRFDDGGYNRYFVKCNAPGTTTSMTARSCGKGCVRPETIDTVTM